MRRILVPVLAVPLAGGILLGTAATASADPILEGHLPDSTAATACPPGYTGVVVITPFGAVAVCQNIR